MSAKTLSRILDEFLDSFVEYPVYYVSIPEVRSDIRKVAENVFELDLPGFEKEQIEVTTTENSIMVRAESKTRKISKRFSVNGFDTSNVTARYRNGVLEISVPVLKSKENKVPVE